MPVRVNLPEKTVQIACGYSHTIANSARGKLFGWGSNKQA
jgi:alpha-tubulin suppressor-like RCC1 family protein